MRFNPLFLQVFYNRLLMPLEQISAQINTGEYESAITSALTIKMLLDNPDWSAFPDYQALLTKLPIQRSILSLLITLDDLKNNKDIENNKNRAMAILTSLKSFAHLLNMLEMAFNDPEKSKLTLFYNISIERGFFNKMKTQNHECENNLQFSNEKDPNNTENNSEKTYAEIITSLYSLKNERLCHVCKNLFLTMDTIEKNDAMANLLKQDENNFFVLGHIEHLISLSNSYKTQFMAVFSEAENHADENEDMTIDLVGGLQN